MPLFRKEKRGLSHRTIAAERLDKMLARIDDCMERHTFIPDFAILLAMLRYTRAVLKEQGAVTSAKGADADTAVEESLRIVCDSIGTWYLVSAKREFIESIQTLFENLFAKLQERAKFCKPDPRRLTPEENAERLEYLNIRKRQNEITETLVRFRDMLEKRRALLEQLTVDPLDVVASCEWASLKVKIMNTLQIIRTISKCRSELTREQEQLLTECEKHLSGSDES